MATNTERTTGNMQELTGDDLSGVAGGFLGLALLYLATGFATGLTIGDPNIIGGAIDFDKLKQVAK